MKRLSNDVTALIALRARAVGEPTRVRILEALAQRAQPVGQLASTLQSQQSTVSKHLQVLFQAGLLQRRRDASAVIYSIADKRLMKWVHYLATPRLPAPSRTVKRERQRV